MPNSTPPPNGPPQPTFEQALEQLEQIVHELEQGEIGLTDALARYEEGVKLLRQCYELLEKAERRIELLSGVDAEGNALTTPLADQPASVEREVGRRGTNS